jgi:endonuclease/exonuclease/phosphatase family metal-dependent hydrolase
LESRESEDLRLSQIEEVIGDADRYPEGTPIVIAGDLNTRAPTPPAIAALEKAGFRKAVGGQVTTVRGAPLDWIFVRGPVSFSEGTVHKDVRASDHFPLSLRIQLDSTVREDPHRGAQD